MWQCDGLKCVVCDTEPNITDPETAITFEHIVPESLGNHEFGEAFLCKKCNGKLGALVDAKLCNHTVIASMRLFFNITGKSGGFPKIQGVVGDIDHASIINGELRLQNYLREVEEGRFKGSATSNNEAAKMVTKTLKRRGYSDEIIAKAQLEAKNLNKEQIENPALEAETSFDKYEFVLPFIKIAFEYALVKLGPKYQNDSVGNLLKNLIHSFIKDAGDITLLESWPIINIYQIVDDHIKQHNLGNELYPKYLAAYANRCFEFKGMPAHVLRIKQAAHGSLFADIVLFCHPFFHYMVPITYNANLYQFTEDADYIICHDDSVDEKDKEALKLFLMDNEKCVFGFPQVNEL